MPRERARAEQFDEALERLRAGDPVVTDDEELRALLDLAVQLERELPPDFPDPAFRARLKEELLETAQAAGNDRPVDLAGERKRRWPFGYWSSGAAAAALAAVLVVGIVAGWGRLTEHATSSSGQTGGTTTQVPAGEEAQPEAGQELLSAADDATETPPFDAQHLVGPQLAYGSAGSIRPSSERAPAPPPSAVTWQLTTKPPTLPTTAPVYRLQAPADPTTFLETTMARLGITGTIEEPTAGATPVYLALDESGHPVLTWFPEHAIFSYNAIEQPTAEPAMGADGADPVGTARRWLEEIGFDLRSIEYVAATTSDAPGITIVRFTPSSLPASGFDVRIEMEVGVASDGTVEFARGHWFSLASSQEVPLRSGAETWQAVQAGEGVWVPYEQPTGTVEVEVSGADLTYVLVRGTEGNYLLQPAVEFRGQVAPPADAATPGRLAPADHRTKRVYVSALQ